MLLFNTDRSAETNSIQVSFTPAAQCRAGFEPCDEPRIAEQKPPVLTALTTQLAKKKLVSWRAMALLSDMDPYPTPRSTLCCDSTVGAYKYCDQEKKGKKERRELKTERGGRDFMYTFNFKHRSKGGNKSKQVSLTPAAQCRAGFESCDERRLAEQKSPISTAQTTQPA